MSAVKDPRRTRIGRIHMGKKALGMSEREYRAFLMRHSGDEHGVGGFDSSAHMTEAQHLQVLKAMADAGFRADRAAANKRRRWPGEPATCDSRPMLRKVRALLADGKKPWSYAHAMAKRMHGVDKVEWCDDQQLHKLVAAMEVDVRRKATGKGKENG